MEHCLLTDLPDDEFRAVLDRLESQDYANLRQVSCCVSKRTIQLNPSIDLSLSDNSSKEQVQQWFEATEHMKDIGAVRVYVTGRLKVEVFALAVQLLTQRPALRSLHLLAHRGRKGNREEATIPTLTPVKVLLAQLHTLVVQGITVRNMPDDMQQLATAAADKGGWPLKFLVLCARWNYGGWSYSRKIHYTSLCSGLQHLAEAFPRLEKLSMDLPRPKYMPCPESDAASEGEDSVQEPLSEGAEDGSEITDQVQSSDDDTAVANGFNKLSLHDDGSKYQGSNGWDSGEDSDSDVIDRYDENPYEQLIELFPTRGVLRAQVVVITALAKAILQLQSLKVLIVDGAPAVWKLKSLDDPSNINAANAADLTAVVADPVHITAMPAWDNFRTLDDLGSWLLQQYSRMDRLHIGTLDHGGGMTWRPTSMQDSLNTTHAALPEKSSSSSSGFTSHTSSCAALAGAESAIHELSAYVCCSTLRTPNGAYTDDVDAGRTGILTCDLRLTDEMLHSHFACVLSQCSFRPIPWLLRQLTSCHLDLWSKHGVESETLVTVLSELKSLKHLKVALTEVHLGGTSGIQDTVSAVLTGAAAVQGLVSLTVQAGAYVDGGDVVLRKLYLNKPFQTLRELKLDGIFPCPHQASFLKRLAQLEELTIGHWDEYDAKSDELHPLLVESLPPKLKVFRGSRIDITSAATSKNKKDDRPQLSILELKECNIGSPDLLASKHMQQLALKCCSWSGGITAAAKAWPAVRKLEWWYKSKASQGSGSLSGLGAADAVCRMLSEFAQLRSVKLEYLPCKITVGLLQAVEHQLGQLNHIRFASVLGGRNNAWYADSDVQKWLQLRLPWADIRVLVWE